MMNDDTILNDIPDLQKDEKIEIIFGNFDNYFGRSELSEKTINNLKKKIINKNMKNYTINCKKYHYKNNILICSNKEKEYLKRTPSYSKIGNTIAVNINKIENIDELSFPLLQKYNCVKIEKVTNFIYNETTNGGKIIISFIEENNNGKKINYIKTIIYNIKKIGQTEKNLIRSISKEIS